MREFVLGDIHGAYQALKQCFDRSKFDTKSDRLIFLGDLGDRGPETFDCVEFLMEVDNLVFIKGNHDIWHYEWLKNGTTSDIWLNNGGRETIFSYEGKPKNDHLELYEKMVGYHIQDDSLFVHAGYKANEALNKQSEDIFCWDRSLVTSVIAGINPKIEDFKAVYVGHTPTNRLGEEKPIMQFGLNMMDTGAGWGGRLSMLDIKTKELFQSDPVADLYH